METFLASATTLRRSEADHAELVKSLVDALCCDPAPEPPRKRQRNCPSATSSLSADTRNGNVMNSESSVVTRSTVGWDGGATAAAAAAMLGQSARRRVVGLEITSSRSRRRYFAWEPVGMEQSLYGVEEEEHGAQEREEVGLGAVGKRARRESGEESALSVTAERDVETAARSPPDVEHCPF